MDLLASLGLGNALPEQSTRLMSHPGIIKALESYYNSCKSAAAAAAAAGTAPPAAATTTTTANDDNSTNNTRHDDDGVRLGFNHCLTCGLRLFVDKKKNNKNDNTNEMDIAAVSRFATTTTTSCQGCHRVNYCSEACRIQDSKPLIVPSSSTTTTAAARSSSTSSSLPLGRRYDDYNNTDEDGIYEDGNGHSPVVCSLLQLCNDDDDAEDELQFGVVHPHPHPHHEDDAKKKKNETQTSRRSRESERRSASSRTSGQRSRSSGSSSSSSRSRRREAAMYRLQTERESYPATLFNILSEGPDWFVESVTRRWRCDDEEEDCVTSSSWPQPKRLLEEGGRHWHQQHPRQQQQEQKSRRGKRDHRSSSSPAVETSIPGRRVSGGEGDHPDVVHDGKGRRSSESGKERELVLHIVGASTDSELWGWDDIPSSSSSSSGERKQDDVPVLNAYAEASTNLSSYLKNLLEIPSITVRCVFIGPDCPDDAGKGTSAPSSHVVARVPIPDEDCSSTLTMEIYRCKYGGRDQPCLPYPDAIVFFNPGFSCPDYDWSAALSAAMAYQYSSIMTGSGGTSSRSSAIPFLITTNTEMEGLADIKYLLDGGYVDEKSLSPDVLELIDERPPANNGGEGRRAEVGKYCDDDDRVTSFFGENPYAGLRVRQSGTMANDLYVKNRWIIGGLFRTCDSGRNSCGKNNRQEQQVGPKKRKSGKVNTDSGEEHEEAGRSKGRKLRHAEGQSEPKDGANNNEKRKNPALI